MSSETYEKTYHREVVRLFEAITSRGAPSYIEDVDFDDCDIYGPAVVGGINDIVMDSCVFDAPPEALFIEAQPERPYVGIIGLQHVRFFQCRFHNVGLLAPAELIEQFTQALTQGDVPP